MEYRGIVREHKLWIKIVALIVAGLVIYRSIMTEQWIYILIGIVVFLACFFTKEHIVDENGADIRYHLFGMNISSYWSWGEITEMQTDMKKAAPYVMLHFGKGVSIRTFIMKPEDIEPVIEMAAENNPDIFIDHMTVEEQEERERQILHEQEVERARKRTSKRRK